LRVQIESAKAVVAVGALMELETVQRPLSGERGTPFDRGTFMRVPTRRRRTQSPPGEVRRRHRRNAASRRVCIPAQEGTPRRLCNLTSVEPSPDAAVASAPTHVHCEVARQPCTSGPALRSVHPGR
jgi:hypothetical protein